MILASCEYGPRDVGYPFDKLFSGVREFSPGKVDFTDVGAVVLWGGEDISPALYGEVPNKFCEASPIPSKRDLFEWGVMKEAVQRGVPIIGVCRGAQILCVFAGGKLYQDVPGHESGHSVVTDTETFSAPANHHQMLCVPEDAEVIGWAGTTQEGLTRAEFYIDQNNALNYFPKGFKEPEIVFFPKVKGLGVQYHPEWAHKHHMCIEFTLNLIKEKLL